jgi:stage V sporulation protein AE
MLSGFKVYDIFIDKFKTGASIPIMNFGHLLVTGASEGYMKNGILGLFEGILSKAGPGISITIISAFIITMIFKIRD